MQSVLASRAPMMAALGNGIAGHDNMISLSLDWEVLGPFQIGTRGKTIALDGNSNIEECTDSNRGNVGR